MFEELGLNVARQPDNAANPRPDNRSGWLEGETPDLVEDLLAGEAEPVAGRPDLKVRLWDPSTQLRFAPSARSRRARTAQAVGHPRPSRSARLGRSG